MRPRSWAQRLRLALIVLLMAPIWLVMIFTGFPPPLPPGQRRRAAQTQGQPWRQQTRRRVSIVAAPDNEGNAAAAPQQAR